MTFRYVDKDRQVAVDDASGIEITQRGRADVGELPFTLKDPNYSPPTAGGRSEFSFPARLVVSRTFAMRDGVRELKEGKVVGYQISEGVLVSLLAPYLKNGGGRLERTKALIVEAICLFHSKYDPDRPLVEFTKP